MNEKSVIAVSVSVTLVVFCLLGWWMYRVRQRSNEFWAKAKELESMLISGNTADDVRHIWHSSEPSLFRLASGDIQMQEMNRLHAFAKGKFEGLLITKPEIKENATEIVEVPTAAKVDPE